MEKQSWKKKEGKGKGPLLHWNWRNLSQLQIIGLGFAGIIFLGALLLTFPFSSKNGTFTSFFDTLFTAVSASCVTGLVVVDTATHWSVIGQLIILIMIQVGGLGFMTFGIFLSIILRNKIGLKQRAIMQESINATQIGGIVRFAKMILCGTAVVEGTGAVLLSIRFIPRFGFAKGIYFSIFHSISAFCNAGFDLFGELEPYGSLVPLNDDPYLLVVFMFLILIGGTGFLVWSDILTFGRQLHRYHLHSKIVLCANLILVVGGAILFLIVERDTTLAGMDPVVRVANAFFESVTPRTAGFNSTDTAAMSSGGMLLTYLLMLIGGGSGSTAGGIKITTFVVLILLVKSEVLRENGCTLFSRRLPDNAVRKAASVMVINLSLIFVGTGILCVVQQLSLTDALFEAFSAMGTVGMTTGITRELTSASRLVIMVLMYCGRVGTLSFALALLDKKKKASIRMPQESILIG